MPETKIFIRKTMRKDSKSKQNNNKSDKETTKIEQICSDIAHNKKVNNKVDIFGTTGLSTPCPSDSDNNFGNSCTKDDSVVNKKLNKKKGVRKSRSEVMNSFDSYDDLMIADSKIHGKGIFTPIDIKEKTLIMEYKGEIIGKLMSDKREKFYNENNFDSIYMFTVLDDMIIDATMTGNKARYINHSCNPNCEAINCIRDRSIKYCSIRHIKANEELTINYNMPLRGNEKCSCGTENCLAKMKSN